MNDKEFVLSQYPKAKVFPDSDGGYVVYVNDVSLADEYLMPIAETEDIAWKYAKMSLKTTQNFNRTHPDRLSLVDIERKLEAIQRRKTNGKRNVR